MEKGVVQGSVSERRGQEEVVSFGKAWLVVRKDQTESWRQEHKDQSLRAYKTRGFAASRRAPKTIRTTRLVRTACRRRLAGPLAGTVSSRCCSAAAAGTKGLDAEVSVTHFGFSWGVPPLLGRPG